MLLTVYQDTSTMYRPTTAPRRRAGAPNPSRSPPADRSEVRRNTHQLAQDMAMDSSDDDEDSGVRLDGGGWMDVTPEEEAEGEENLLFPVTIEERYDSVEP